MVVDAFDITVAVTAWMVLLLKEKSIEQHQEGNFIVHCKHHHQPRQDKHFQNKVAWLGVDQNPFELLGVLVQLELRH